MYNFTVATLFEAEFSLFPSFSSISYPLFKNCFNEHMFMSEQSEMETRV